MCYLHRSSEGCALVWPCVEGVSNFFSYQFVLHQMSCIELYVCFQGVFFCLQVSSYFSSLMLWQCFAAKLQKMFCGFSKTSPDCSVSSSMNRRCMTAVKTHNWQFFALQRNVKSTNLCVSVCWCLFNTVVQPVWCFFAVIISCALVALLESLTSRCPSD